MQSTLRDRIRQRKDFILNHWSRGILDSDEKGTHSFLREPSDRFANPVAYAWKEAMEAICRALMEDQDVDRGALDYVMKIQAVQGSDPAKGIAFIPLLKKTVWQELGNAATEEEWADLAAQIDRMASVAWDMFAAHRAKIAALAARCGAPLPDKI